MQPLKDADAEKRKKSFVSIGWIAFAGDIVVAIVIFLLLPDRDLALILLLVLCGAAVYIFLMFTRVLPALIDRQLRDQGPANPR